MKNLHSNITDCMIVLAVVQILCQTTNAVKNETHVSLNQKAVLHLNTNSNGASQDSQLLCSYQFRTVLTCQQSEPLLIAGYCATYNNHTNLVSILECPYFQPNGYNYTSQGSVLLAQSLNQLNDYMCGPLNRKGLVCSECADGFGPSVTSFGYRCVNCKNVLYGVPLFLLVKLSPITILYLIILIFQIRVTSPPMPCLIMYAQFMLIAFDPNHTVLHDFRQVIFTDVWYLRLDMNIILSLYRVLNLDFVQNLLAPYCVSNRLKFIHIAFLDYISAFYPIILIFLTWACVELHSRNFRLLVWLWRPFHTCFVRLRRGWDPKSDIIDVFITFFFLTYNKILYQVLLLVTNKPIKKIELSGEHFLTYVSVVDHSVKFGGIYHLSFAIPGILISLAFNILPPLMLILCPIRTFRTCISKCHLNFAAINTFLDKVYGCYRNGLDGGRDMRSFSGLYFFLQVVVYLIYVLSHSSSFINPLFCVGTLLFIIILAITIGKPYQKAYMNHLDTLLLSNFMIICYGLSSGLHIQLVARTLIAAPIAVFIIITIFQRVYAMIRVCSCHKLNKSFNCFRSNITTESTQSSNVSNQPLLQPTSAVVSYGIKGH